MSDICEQHGLVLAGFSKETTRRVHELLPPLAMRSNPVDMGPAWYDWETIRKVIEAVLADENIDSLVLYAAYASANRPLLKELTGLLQSPAYEKPIISCFPSPPEVWTEEKRELEESGVLLYSTPERAAKTLVGLVKRSQIARR